MNLLLTVNNIVAIADERPMYVVEYIQAMLDNDSFHLAGIDEVHQLRRQQDLYAYYGSLAGSLLGLWGAMRIAARSKDHSRIAIRDYLESALSVCKKKYDAASRIQTSHEMIREDTKMERGRN